MTAGPFGGYTTLDGPPGFSAHSTITPAGDGSAGYRFSVYEKGMLPDRASLEKNWQPWLDGTVLFEETLRNLVRDVAR